MRILVDRHHSDLLYSLQLLFEDRLNVQLFVTIGHEWWDEGYWRFGEVWGDDRLARQFLNLNDQYREVEPGIYVTFDPCHPERPLYGITLEKARSLDWSFILATVQDNQKGFKKFAEEMGAKYLYHVGNARQWIDWSLEPYVLNASDAPMTGRGVYIAQEFDHMTIFKYRRPENHQRVTSFVNLLAKMPEQWEDFERFKACLPYECRSYGHECPDGFLKPIAAVAAEMARAGWGYHDKPTGDGFGHIIHNWAAIGRPLIGHARYYEGQRAYAFWQDGETCIDLDKHSIPEAAEIVMTTSPERHREMCRAIRKTLEGIFSPAKDAASVYGMLRDFYRKEVLDSRLLA